MRRVPVRPAEFATLVFDCDGVILDSNHIKTEAFRHVASRYGAGAADALVRFHVENGGVSRYRKFEHLLMRILARPADESSVRALTDAYGERVYDELLRCEIASGLRELREATGGQAWMVVSGGDEMELRKVFAARGLDAYFDRGIHGSPAAKETILRRELLSGNLTLPALFAGDSRYDHEAAARAGLQFVFVRGWSEFRDWQPYCALHGIPVVDTIGDLLGTPRAATDAPPGTRA